MKTYMYEEYQVSSPCSSRNQAEYIVKRSLHMNPTLQLALRSWKEKEQHDLADLHALKARLSDPKLSPLVGQEIHRRCEFVNKFLDSLEILGDSTAANEEVAVNNGDRARRNRIRGG